jgi:enoyl-CoA hydratase/carnithine racemase
MTPTSDLIRSDHPGGVVCLTLSNAPVNALSAEGLLQFSRMVQTLEADQTVRAIVLASPFKVFSAGLNLKEAQSFDLAAQNAIVKGLNEGFLALFACSKPTVIAVNGAAIAGGLFYVLASDYRLAVPRATFGLAEVRVGADFPLGPLEIARATLSPNDLRRLMLTGQPMSAEDARTSGIVDRIVDPEALLAEALAEAAKLGQIPPATFASVKQQIRGDAIAKIKAGIAAGANAPNGGWFNDETIPAMRAMLGG